LNLKISKPTEDNKHLLLRVRLVSRVALFIGMLACLSMVLVLAFITDQSGVSYDTIIRSYSLSQEHLVPTLLVAGLLLVTLSGVITFVISLYTGFCIAGPLYRFARNLEMFIEQGLVAPVPIRAKDQLKQEERQIMHGITRLKNHYGAIHATAEAALMKLAAQQDASAEIAHLKELEREVRL